MRRPECVSEENLRAFLLGDLPDRLAQIVGSHLETCPECEAAAQRHDHLTDPMIRSLQRVLATVPDRKTWPAPSTATAWEGSGTVAKPAHADPPSRLRCVGGYELLEELGRGGMGVVYKARQFSPNRLVALKTILAGGFSDPGRRARFLAEGDALARLQHRNIVQIYEVGQHDGLPFLVLEYLGGGTLAQQLRGVPQPPRQAAVLVETLARAVHHAHTHGVVHRDLKPCNILLGVDGQPKITDFGLARHERPELTATGDVLGTPSYMAPEQAVGGSTSVGPAADVYALGALLYECLTGRPPFHAATPLETLEQLGSQEPVAPLQLQARTPRSLNTICLKCLEKDPSRRYATARELAEDMRRFLQGEVILARPVWLVERAWRWCRRKPAVASLLAFAAVLTMVTVLVSTVSAWRLGIEAERARRAERDATERFFKATFIQAQALRKSGEMGQRFESLARLEEAVGVARSLGVLEERTLALRNEAIACLSLVDLHSTREWDGPARGDPFGVPVVFDGNLKRHACLDPTGNISVLETDSKRAVMRLPAPDGKVQSVDHRFAHDGRFLAAVYHLENHVPQFILWSLQPTGPTYKVGPLSGVACFALQESNRQLAVSHADASLSLYDLEHDSRRTIPGLHGRVMAFHPDGRQLAFNTHGEQHQVQILELETAQIVRRLTHPDDVQTVAWSADGRLLAAGCDDRNVHVWDAKGLQQQSILEGHQGGVRALMFSPFGELLVSSGLDETTRLWDPVSGRQLVSAPGKALRFGPDGRQMAYVRGGRIGIWEVADGRECHVLHPGRIGNRATPRTYKGPHMLDFSPDGRLLLSAGPVETGSWWRPATTSMIKTTGSSSSPPISPPNGCNSWNISRSTHSP